MLYKSVDRRRFEWRWYLEVYLYQADGRGFDLRELWLLSLRRGRIGGHRRVGASLIRVMGRVGQCLMPDARARGRSRRGFAISRGALDETQGLVHDQPTETSKR